MGDIRLTLSVGGHTEVFEGNIDEVSKKLAEAGRDFRKSNAAVNSGPICPKCGSSNMTVEESDVEPNAPYGNRATIIKSICHNCGNAEEKRGQRTVYPW